METTVVVRGLPEWTWAAMPEWCRVANECEIYGHRWQYAPDPWQDIELACTRCGKVITRQEAAGGLLRA